MRCDAQVPERLRLNGLVASLRCQVQRLLQEGDRGGVVVPDDLVQAADPEQRFGLSANVTELLVQPGGTLEQRQFAGVLVGRSRVLVAAQQKPRMHQPAARHGQVGLRRVKLPVSFGQRAGLATEDGSLVELLSPADPLVHAVDCLRHPLRATRGTITRHDRSKRSDQDNRTARLRPLPVPLSLGAS